MDDEGGITIRLPFCSLWVSARFWWRLPRMPWRKWHHGYIRAGEELLWVDDLGITKAQWWNGFLTTQANGETYYANREDVERHLVERHERILDGLRARGLVVESCEGMLSYRGGFSMWDRIVVKPQVASEEVPGE